MARNDRDLPRRTTLDDVIAACRAYVRDNHPGDRPVRLCLALASGEEVRLPVPRDSLAECDHSPDFREVRWFGRTYHFTATQAAAVKFLWEARDSGTPEVGAAALLEAAGSESESPRDLFRRHPAWDDEVIGRGASRGTWRLYAPGEIDTA